MGGINGVLKGLGTDPKRGLLTHSLFLHDEETADSTDPEQAAPPSSSRNSTSPVDASAETRQRIYDVNILPTRASKTLLQLMIKAFDDKVLIAPLGVHSRGNLESTILGGCVIGGPAFRKLNSGLKYHLSPRIQALVSTLKHLGEIVGVTSDGINDGPALREANVGFSMGIAGTEVAKEASDIILMDNNFTSFVKAIIWGLCVNGFVRKFLQFHIFINVTAVVITFVTTIASDDEKSVLSAVQLLWINIIMDTFAALVLATNFATDKLLNRKPDRNTSSLFTIDMYEMALCQSIYQIIVIFIFLFLGRGILGYANDKHGNTILQTLVFNAFVFAQIFNSINCRRLDRELNIFEGIFNDHYFISITAILIAIPSLIVSVGSAAFQVNRIPGYEYGISLALGVISIPLGVIVRLFLNGPYEWFFNKLGLLNHSTGNIFPFTETLYGAHKDARRFAAGQRSRSRRLWAANTSKKVSQSTVISINSFVYAGVRTAQATDINFIRGTDTIPKHSPNNNISKLLLSAISILLFFANTACGIPIEQDTNLTSTSTYLTPLTAPLSGSEINKAPRSKEHTWIARIVLIVIVAAIFLAALLSICTRRASSSIQPPGRARGTPIPLVHTPNVGTPGAPTNPANVPPLALPPVLHTPANTNSVRATATVAAVIVHAEVVAVDMVSLDADTTLKDIVV